MNKGLQWFQRKSLCSSGRFDSQALTLTLLLGFSGNDGFFGIPKSGYVLHLEESSVS